MRTFASAVAFFCFAGMSYAEPGQPSADAGEGVAEVEKEREFPLGWLSDPDEAPADLFDAIVSGKVHLNNRFRVEFADTTGRDESTAITNRLRLGYESKPYLGFSGFVEMENVASPDEDNYWVPATMQGTPTRTVIADPTGTEMNQAYGRYSTGSLFEGGSFTLDLRAGRQRIILDDSRFVGNVGWRQFEQTYDAVSVRTNLGVDKLSVFYAYVWHVQRIFGPDGPTPDSSTHLINASFAVAPELKITPFVYLIDFETDDPANSSDSFGVRVSGRLFQSPDDDNDLFADYELTYAHQEDAGSNPTSYEADFFAAQIKVTKKGLGYVVAGYQLLGSDGGMFAFRFPLGTNHKFQGFADNFLTTPAAGLRDVYVGVGADLPWNVKGAVVFHDFRSDFGSMDFGQEVDVVAGKKITDNWSVLVKAAHLDGDGGMPNTHRVWVETTYTF